MLGVAPEAKGPPVKVHHLNCGTMNAFGIALLCHVLLVETDDGLVLVDTGFGIQDCLDPGRVGLFRHVLRPAFLQAETAARQIEQLGYRTSDVRHIVLTHFDFDHIGGIADFPEAHLHVTAAEARGAIHAPAPRATAISTRTVGPRPEAGGARSRRGTLARIRIGQTLDSIGTGVVLVPMPGHTRGHAAVAVDAGHRWVLHCGDAFYHRGTLDGRFRVPFVMRAEEKLLSYNRNQLRDNQARIVELHRRHDPDLLIVCAHDPDLYQLARDTA